MDGLSGQSLLPLLVAFLVVVPLMGIAARWLRLPYTVAFVLFGLVVSGAFELQSPRVVLEVRPDLVVALLLPGLVFEGAYRLDGVELRRTFWGVAILAVPGVLIAAAVVAIVLNLAGLPLEQAFIVGAMVSATDPVAVVATMRRLRAPRRLVTLIDAESLFNDGTGILVFTIALGAIGSQTSLGDSALSFIVTIAGSIALGAASGLLIAWVAARIDDHLIVLTLTLLAAYGTYFAADSLHESGIIASVVAGITLGTFGPRFGMSLRTQEAIDTVWEFLAFILTAIVFLLVGVAITLESLAAAIGLIAWGVVAVIAGRALVVYGILGGAARVERAFGLVPSLPTGWLHVMNWAGLRGAVATALALSLPADFPDRTLLQGITFGIVLFTVVVQGVTAERVVRWSRVDREPTVPAEA